MDCPIPLEGLGDEISEDRTTQRLDAVIPHELPVLHLRATPNRIKQMQKRNENP